MDKTELRIVAGELRGRKIHTVVHEGMRPTPQMVREALFSILGNAIPGRIFYDVFAGTGVFGLEAISRGAKATRLIEKDPKQAQAIQKLIDRFGVADRAQVLRADAYRWAERWIPPIDAVNLFLSPPFPDLSPGKLDGFVKLVETLFEKSAPDSCLVIQGEDGFDIETIPNINAYETRKYGRNLLL
ncbi:MAG: RsmD family RNA methyltransferase, partial [Gemmataceae bacterium]